MATAQWWDVREGKGSFVDNLKTTNIPRETEKWGRENSLVSFDKFEALLAYLTGATRGQEIQAGAPGKADTEGGSCNFQANRRPGDFLTEQYARLL